MFHSTLPFKVLGQVAPILTWAESDDGSQLPDVWSSESVPFHLRERGWLTQELPTYSYDNVRDIITGARRDHRQKQPVSLPFASDRRRRAASLSPPDDYDLLDAFRILVHYFLIWNGTEPCVREGTMVDLHELAIRLPAGHILCHAHARAISEGVLSFEEALELPEMVTLLPSNSFGLRSVIRKGLSESHLHLKGVTSAEESWADNLLRPLSSQGVRGDTPAQHRLLMLNLFAGRLLALAIWHSFTKPGARLAIEAGKLLSGFDRIYFGRSEGAERAAITELDKSIHTAVYGAVPEHELDPQDEEDPRPRDARGPASPDRREKKQRRALVNQPVEEHYQFLLRWMAPTAFRLKALARGRVLPSGIPEDPQERNHFVHRLHLAAHLRLVELSARDDGHDRQHEGKSSAKKSARAVNPRRHFLHQALFRYIVCRTHFWQQATLQGRTTGLSRFRQFWSSDSRKVKGVTQLQQAELTFHRLSQWRGLRVLEGRVGPPKGPHDLVPWILAFARPEHRRIEKFGLVIHFKKEEEKVEEKTFSKRIKKPVPRLRWGKRRRMVRAEGQRLYRLLQRPTPIAPFVVGIDAANLELATPPEVFAPVFRFLRELPIPLQGQTQKFSPFVNLGQEIKRLTEHRRLGMTYHVGEDFRHLLSGLRAISETVEFLRPNPGDRLGHGTALALDPEHWLEHNGYQAVMSKLEWLDTLVWVHHFMGPGDKVVGELAIEDTIQRLGWEIYSRGLTDLYDPLRLDQSWRSKSPDPPGSANSQEARPEPPFRQGFFDWDWSPLTLWDAWSLRQIDPYCVDLRELLTGKLQLPRASHGASEEERRWRSIQGWAMEELRPNIGSRNAYLLLALYWYSNDVRDNGDETLVIDMRDDKPRWRELCSRVEQKMKKLIHGKELVIEVNPSANRIIGPMARYHQHHVFDLTLDEENRLARYVRVSVNTDNPAVCNTTLAHEHYLLGEVLIGQGVPEAEVVNWLDWLRQNGNDYNFVRRLKTAEDSPDMERLLGWLRSIRPSVREGRTRAAKLEGFWTWHRTTRLQSFGFSSKALSQVPTSTLEQLIRLQNAVEQLREESPPDVTTDSLRDALRRLEEQLRAVKEEIANPASSGA